MKLGLLVAALALFICADLAAPTESNMPIWADRFSLLRAESYGVEFLIEPSLYDRFTKLHELKVLGWKLVRQHANRRPLANIYLKISQGLDDIAKTGRRPAVDVAYDQRSLFGNYQTVFERFINRIGTENEIGKALFAAAAKALEESGIAANERAGIADAINIFEQAIQQTAWMTRLLNAPDNSKLLDAAERLQAQAFVHAGVDLVKWTTVLLLSPDLAFYPDLEQGEAFFINHWSRYPLALQNALLMSLIYDTQVPAATRYAAFRLSLHVLPTSRVEDLNAAAAFGSALPPRDSHRAMMWTRDLTDLLTHIPEIQKSPAPSLPPKPVATFLRGGRIIFRDRLNSFIQATAALPIQLRRTIELHFQPIQPRAFVL